MITLVTSNPHKAAEFKKILVGTEIQTATLEIPEIQSFDLQEIVREKVVHAQRVLGGAVMVEDVALDLEVLGGFPGTFVKFWEKNSRHDLAAGLVQKMGKDRVTARSGFGYADGNRFLYAEGKMDGRFVTRRGTVGFGFDFYFVPDGETQTLAELGPDRKMELSHRRHGLDAMRELLIKEGIISQKAKKVIELHQ